MKKMYIETRKICWEYEDSLDIDITEEMFSVSKIIDGVRMYPYILIDFGKYYLES
jgi:hypothetical protein